ncbi:hypothetical protein [Dokdonella sp.]
MICKSNPRFKARQR